MIRIPVDLPGRPYEVVVGDGARDELTSLLPAGTRRAAIVTQQPVGWIVDPGIEHEIFVVPDGETAKALAVVEDLCRRWSRWGLHRGDIVVGLGGGVVTDVAGFAAAVYHRGLPVVHVATTLLAQVDAAIGGKTGVNLSEGKNLVGAFWQPTAVVCDTEMLSTLPAAELRSGLGEVAKYQLLGVAGLDTQDRPTQVARCVQMKAEIVVADERESGRRALLNYGHTLGHALEALGGHQLRHGEAIAIGLVFAARLAAVLGRVDDERVRDHERVVGAYGLPTELPRDADPTELLELMYRDKKAGSGLTFVLDGPHGPEVVDNVSADAVEVTLTGGAA